MLGDTASTQEMTPNQDKLGGVAYRRIQLLRQTICGD